MKITETSSALRWWPCFVGGLLWPLVAMGLKAWFPLPLAAAASFVLLFSAAGLVFLRKPPVSSFTFGRWITGALAGGLVTGFLTYLRPWA